MYELLQKTLIPTNTMVKNLIKIQDSYVNTYHPDFMGGANSITNVFDPSSYKKDELTENNLRSGSDFEEINHSDLPGQMNQSQVHRPFGQGVVYQNNQEGDKEEDEGNRT